LFYGSFVFSFGQGRTALGAEGGVPTGSNTDGIGTGFGAWIRHEKGINKKFTWTASAGYLYFPASASATFPIPGSPPITFSLTGHYNFAPVLLGTKFYLSENFSGLYFGAEFGVTVRTFKGTILSYGYSQSVSERDNKFTMVPAVGFHTKRFDLAFRYTIIDQSNYCGARIGYTLN
jgi:hypothetical protein